MVGAPEVWRAALLRELPGSSSQLPSAALGTGEQRRRIYMPRALSKFRQGFGRLMRRASDRGCVFVLDPRIHDPRHRTFLNELPLRAPDSDEPGAAFVRGDVYANVVHGFSSLPAAGLIAFTRMP